MAGSLRVGDTGVVIPERNATTSLEFWILSNKGRHVRIPEFLTLDPRLGFVRDPKERLESSYAHYLKNRDPEEKAATFGDYVTRIVPRLIGESNIVKPQVEQFEPYNLTNYLFWDFPALAMALGIPYVDIEHRNVSEKSEVSWTKAITKAFEEIYAKDLELWSRK